MKKQAIVVFTCDIWKTKTTFNFVGVYTNHKSFLKAIRKLIKNGDIQLQNGYDMDNLDNWSYAEIHNYFDYISLVTINLNDINI